MTTAKKTPTKKAPVTKKAPAKKATVKKQPKAVAAPALKSFKLSKNPGPFLSARITRQTVYWSILLIIVLILEIWILNIQLDVIELTDSINNQL